MFSSVGIKADTRVVFLWSSKSDHEEVKTTAETLKGLTNHLQLENADRLQMGTL